MVERGKLNFGHNVTMRKSFMYANFGDPRSRDRDLENQKPEKAAIFRLKIY